MTFRRSATRHCLTALALALLVTGCDTPGASRTLSIMAPAAPGGGWDQTARAMQQVLQENELVAHAQVVNVPGAGGTIGLARIISDHRADGDILLVTGLIMMGSILTNESAVTLEQVTPIARLTGEYEVLVVPADSPHRTLGEFVAAWKRDPGAQAIAGGSAGGADHMLAGLMARSAGIDMSDVNYIPHSGGGASLSALLGGHVAAGINGYAELQSFIEAGRLRALALSSEARVEGIAVPTFVEQGMDVTLANWRGVAAPPGLTATQKRKLLALVEALHASGEWRRALERNNWIDLYLDGAEYETFLERENRRVAAVLEAIGLVE